MPKLTDQAIKATTCPDSKDRIEIADSACPGLVLRVTRGRKTFRFVYWSPVLGKPVGLNLGTYPALKLGPARKKVAKHRETIGEDKDPRREAREERKKVAKQEELTFDAFADIYICEYVIGGKAGKEAVQKFAETGKWPKLSNPNKRSWRNDVNYLQSAREAWGKLPAASITDDDVAELLDEIAERAPVSANRTQSILHTMFNWGRQPGRKHVPLNPVAGLHQRGGKEKKRERVLSDEEIRTLWWGLEHPDVPCDLHVRLAIKFILVTMVRPYQSAYVEVAELSNLGTSNALYDIPPLRVKKFRPALVPLSDLAQEIIDRAMAPPAYASVDNNNPPEPIEKEQTVLFPSRFSNRDISIRRDAIAQALNGKKDEKRRDGTRKDRIGIREFLGLAHFTAHDLRRTAATIARRAGAPRPDVKAMLDHVNGDVTDVYDKYDMLAEKRAVVTILAGELRRIVGVPSDF